MNVLRCTDRKHMVMYNNISTIPKTIYFSEEDLPVFKNRLRGRVRGRIEGVPEECSVIIIPLLRGVDPRHTGVGTEISLEEPLDLVVNGDVIASLCDTCSGKSDCIGVCIGVIHCMRYDAIQKEVEELGAV